MALGAAHSLGPLWIGGGAALARDFGRWRVAPFVQATLEAAPVRVDVRVEAPAGSGGRLYLPVGVGIPLPR